MAYSAFTWVGTLLQNALKAQCTGSQVSSL